MLMAESASSLIAHSILYLYKGLYLVKCFLYAVLSMHENIFICRRHVITHTSNTIALSFKLHCTVGQNFMLLNIFFVKAMI